MAASITRKSGALAVTAYTGDSKTLLAFNLDKGSIANLAGFTIQCQPEGQPAYYLQNNLRFEKPEKHAQDAQEPANSSINAPFHKFRWLHVPGSVHEGLKPLLGKYTYTVTPRYFDAGQSMLPLDPALGVSLKVNVGRFSKGGLELGFTRGFTQSQAFTHHFGLKALIRPPGDDLLYDTTQVSGTNAAGEQYTYADEYEWLGFSAREKIFALLEEVVRDKSLYLDVFAYDLNEPDLCKILIALAKQGRIRIILDNAGLHHSSKTPKPEDEFEQLFTKAAKKPAQILRGHFKRYAHDKVFIVTTKTKPVKVLTGSTNFSYTGLYVNSNHILQFNSPEVAGKYVELFEDAWQGAVKLKPFLAAPISGKVYAAPKAGLPATSITFAPHTEEFATGILDGITARIKKEGNKSAKTGSVLFAVMSIGQGSSPVYDALKTLHADQGIFSYGISDTTSGIALYAPGKKNGVLVTGKPARTMLPPPFNQVRNIGGVGHQVHHKFVVCGFNGDDPTVYCGSSNLALGGEQANGDNLLEIHDAEVATAFAIEAVGLVDHFQFLDRSASSAKALKTKAPPANKVQAAAAGGWFLSTTDQWAASYYDPGDLHCVDRLLFG